MAVTAQTNKASDKEWFRIRVFNYVCIVFQVIFGLVNVLNMTA